MIDGRSSEAFNTDRTKKCKSKLIARSLGLGNHHPLTVHQPSINNHHPLLSAGSFVEDVVGIQDSHQLHLSNGYAAWAGSFKTA